MRNIVNSFEGAYVIVCRAKAAVNNSKVTSQDSTRLRYASQVDPEDGELQIHNFGSTR